MLMRSVLTLVFLVLTLLSPGVAEAQVGLLQTGDEAPDLPEGFTILSVAEPPSISEGGFVVMHVAIDGPGGNDPLAIYRWHQGFGFKLVATTGQGVSFPGGTTRTITFFESPIVDEDGNVSFTANLDVGKGLIVWDKDFKTDLGTPILAGAIRTGHSVVLTCDTVSGDPCTPVSGSISTLGNFTQRTSAAAWLDYVFIRAGVTPSGGGAVDALWLYDIDTLGLLPVANSRQQADGVPPEMNGAKAYYQAFTNVAMCGGMLYGLADISQGAPKTVYRFLSTGENHLHKERGWPPDMVPRFDFHCLDGQSGGDFWGYAGSYSLSQTDTSPEWRGVWINTQRFYSNTVTAAPAPVPATTLGVPRGQTMMRNGTVSAASVYAAKLVGGTANGKSGLFFAVDPSVVSAPFPVAYELQPYANGPYRVEKIYTAHVNDENVVIFHQRRADAGGALADAIGVTNINDPMVPLMTVGDSIDVGNQTATITGFRLLGRDFVDTVVSGIAGDDGLLSAYNDSDQLVLVIDYIFTGGGVAGATRRLHPRGTGGSGVFVVDATPSPVLDIDGNGEITALTDGLLLLRRLFGFGDATLIGGALGQNCTRCTGDSIETYVDSLASKLDIDDNTEVQALSDGLLVLRHLFGFGGSTLTSGALGGGCMRCEAAAIAAYIDGLM
jgi:hypothetical protein